MEKLSREPMSPEPEDLEILRVIVARIQVEFQLGEEGTRIPNPDLQTNYPNQLEEKTLAIPM